MTMRTIASALACLICTCHGLPVHTSRFNNEADAEFVKALATLLLTHNPADAFISSGLHVRKGHPSFARSSSAVLDGSRPSAMGRREFGRLAAAALASQALAARAYDTLPPRATFAEAEAAGAEFAKMKEKNIAEMKPYLDAIAKARTSQEFGDAADSYSVYLLGKPRFPEGPNVRAVRDLIVEAYDNLPRKKYKCAPTRTNNGVCLLPGPPADKALNALLDTLKLSAQKPQKGALISDGVSAYQAGPF